MSSHAKPRYSNALRCIGQSLESLDLKAVELKTVGESFVVQGRSKAPQALLEIDKHYTPDDIKALESQGRGKRDSNAGPANLLSLSQVLRLAGNYVDRAGGRLLRVSWQDQSEKIQSVTIQYEACVSEHSEDSQITTVEELSIHIYKQRKRMALGSEKTGTRSLTSTALGHESRN
ncbi:MAG: hypothetical protein FJ143_05495 [Deltaproteobacteria bacterium]|nr:hypothetical protein [Deltaproteobacteria bacterium]MBM4297176.1 hypothetical protein [Deltaproteobacteria bacterium]